VNIKLFSDLQNRIRKRSLPHLDEWIAERPSPYSASPNDSFEWFPNCTTARQAQIIIFLSLYLEKWETDRIHEHLAQLAFRYQYNGEWRRVQDFLESFDTPADFFRTYLEARSEDEFFGNFLLECNRYIRYYKSYYRKVGQKGPVIKGQRKRGYDDKGTLRPYHQRGRMLPDPRPEPEDRRFLIKHPLSKFLKE